MRYDDRIDTVVGWRHATAEARAQIWVQLIDLIGQGGDADAQSRAVKAARELGAVVPIDRRRIVAERMGEGPVSPALVALFCEEIDLARAALASVQFSEQDWLILLPRLGDRARALLAARHDLPPVVAERLAPREKSQIVDLLARIEAFQQARPDAEPEDEPAPEGFAFSVDETGHFTAADGAPLAARLGAEPYGVDGQAIGAWRARMAMADARLEIAAGTYAGVWRISASPIVDKAGALLGYRGIARLPRPDEVAAPVEPAGVASQGLNFVRAVDALRDPLAALAEADLPEGGPVTLAQRVADQGQMLAETIDHFAAIAAQTSDAPLDLGGMLERLHGLLAPLAETRGMTLDFRIPAGLPQADVDPEALERMVTRLVTSVVPLGRKRERIVARLSRDRDRRRRVTLTLTRPGRLVGRSAEQLRDPQGEDAPMLALGFALRLVEKLAHEAGGTLIIADDRLMLSLPARACQPRRGSAIA